MSVFQVQLNNTNQGTMDRNFSGVGWSMVANGATPGVEFTTSQQRQVFIMGPNKNQMLLHDGAQFTGSNYFKRFCYPALPLEDAILALITDDGSTYSDFNQDENTAVAGTTLTIAKGSSFTTSGNSVNVVTTYGAPATFTQIQVNGTTLSDYVTVEINGNANALLNILVGTSQIFNTGDSVITQLNFSKPSGNTDASSSVQLVFGILPSQQASGFTAGASSFSQGTVFPLGPGGTLV